MSKKLDPLKLRKDLSFEIERLQRRRSDFIENVQGNWDNAMRFSRQAFEDAAKLYVYGYVVARIDEGKPLSEIKVFAYRKVMGVALDPPSYTDEIFNAWERVSARAWARLLNDYWGVSY